MPDPRLRVILSEYAQPAITTPDGSTSSVNIGTTNPVTDKCANRNMPNPPWDDGSSRGWLGVKAHSRLADGEEGSPTGLQIGYISSPNGIDVGRNRRHAM